MANTGWVNAGTAENITNVLDDFPMPWVNPDNAKTSDNSRALCQISKLEFTHWLRMTNFSFGIPAGSTINGIEVKIERRASTANDIGDHRLRLVKDGVTSGDNKASATKWSTTEAIAYYGSASDLWNSGYGYADVTDSGFGVQLVAIHVDFIDVHWLDVDHIAIRITYEPPAYDHDVNDVPASNIASVNDVPTANINTINDR